MRCLVPRACNARFPYIQAFIFRWIDFTYEVLCLFVFSIVYYSVTKFYVRFFFMLRCQLLICVFEVSFQVFTLHLFVSNIFKRKPKLFVVNREMLTTNIVTEMNRLLILKPSNYSWTLRNIKKINIREMWMS